MALQHTPDVLIFTAILPNGTLESFSFGEYLAWREKNGIPILEKNWLQESIRMDALDNNNGRINCWISVILFRREFPDDPAVKYFRDNQP